MWYDLNNVDLRNAQYLLFFIRIHIKTTGTSPNVSDE